MNTGGWKKNGRSGQAFQSLFESGPLPEGDSKRPAGIEVPPSATGMSFLNDSMPNNFK
jgi:hypothetical protein